MDKNNLQDVAAVQNDSPSSNAYSFWRRKQDRNINSSDQYQATRIDHFLTDIPTNEIAIKYLRYFPSDHALVENENQNKPKVRQKDMEVESKCFG